MLLHAPVRATGLGPSRFSPGWGFFMGNDMSFEVFVERVLSHEGGFVDHPSDPGGATNFGITQAVARQNGYQGEMRSLSRAQAIQIYRQQYWDKIQGDQLPPAVAFQVFDAAVNHGVGNAARWLQEAVGASIDGAIGPKTVSATKFKPPCEVVVNFNAKRIKFYTKLGTFSAFGKGWMNRVAGNLEWAAKDLV